MNGLWLALFHCQSKIFNFKIKVMIRHKCLLIVTNTPIKSSFIDFADWEQIQFLISVHLLQIPKIQFSFEDS